VGDTTDAHRILVGETRVKRQQEDLGVEGRIIKSFVQEVGWGSMDRIDLAEDRNRWPSTGKNRRM